MQSSSEVCISSPGNRYGSTMRLCVLYSNIISQEKEEKKLEETLIGPSVVCMEAFNHQLSFPKTFKSNTVQVNSFVLSNLSNSSQDLHCKKEKLFRKW